MSGRLLRLPARLLARRDAIELLVRRVLRPPTDELARTVHAFAFKCDERSFARALLDRATQLWLYRCHQQRFCGDFVVVDRSSPDPSLRTAWVLDLKRGAPLRLGGGGAGFQLSRADHAVDELVRDGLLAPGRWIAATGDADALLGWLTDRPAWWWRGHSAGGNLHHRP